MTDIFELLASNMKNYRTIRGFSQADLAEQVNVSTKHIGMIEAAKQFPSPKLLTRIAAALGVDTPELFSVEKAHILPVHKVSLQKLHQDILGDIETILTNRIEGLKGE
jgi:transcriptional regulator with XRE-family HTH domain